MNDIEKPMRTEKIPLISTAFDKTTHAFVYIARLWFLFAASCYYAVVEPWRNPRVIRRQATAGMMLEAGVRSLPILLLINFLVGVILAMQSAYQLKQFGMTDLVSGLVAITVCREIGPLITAIIVSARVGAAITAELGTMVVGEEIMALQTMALRPIPFLVVPRLIALTLMLPCVTIIADFTGMFGGFCVGVMNLDQSMWTYINGTVDNLSLTDIYTGLAKSVGFGVVIAIVSCHEGLSVEGGAEGVGSATTRSVVYSILFIIITDLIFTAVFFL
ncbi:MAG: ABC transporter permease [Candidatus Omnitrophota bacterium]|nr:MAG: ABC transporter permease [Candidatus Omnitrophota bacterium]